LAFDFQIKEKGRARRERLIMIKFFQQYPELVCAFSAKEDGNMSFGHKNPVANRRAFIKKLGLKIENLITAHQPHKNRVAVVDEKHRGRGAVKKDWLKGYDALITDESNVVLGITAGDCLPIFMYDKNKQVIAAVHIGYRCLPLGLIENVGKALKNKYGCDLKNLEIEVGPHIQKCCFEVQDDVWKLFAKYPRCRQIVNAKKYISLIDIVKAQLKANGFDSKKIKASKACTCCDRKYFSYRRSHVKNQSIGIMLGVICKR
jgi:polyphenol oxidase